MRVRYRFPLLLLVCAAMTIVTATPVASADVVDVGYNEVIAKAEGTKKKAGSSAKAAVGKAAAGTASKPKYTYVPKAEYQKRMEAWRTKVAAIKASNLQSAIDKDVCITSPTQLACGRFTQQALPSELDIRAAGEPATPGAGLDPTTIAYLAVARLTLAPPTPGIGPPPQINRWKMAAVGYPLWLWADGNLDPAPVSQTVYDLTVSLDARVVKVVYDMGDGHKVTCTGPTHRWTQAVEAGAESPSCGYRYQKASLPKGEYTVTAHTVWAVDWRINGATGTVPMYQSASTTLPVGEVQALVR